MILTQVVIPYISKKFLRRLEQVIQYGAEDTHSKMKNTILVIIPLLKQLLNGMCLV